MKFLNRSLFRCLTIVLCTVWWGGSTASAQESAPPLLVGSGDVAVEARQDGYHLFIRQVPGAASVLLTEAFEPPGNKLATFAFRAVQPNPLNDGEKRILNGQFLALPHHSLISSTPVDHPLWGKAFHIVIPRVVEYGYPDYPNSRHGTVDIQKALASPGKTFWFSIRVFAKPYADYSGPFKESAFELSRLLSQTNQPGINTPPEASQTNSGPLVRPYLAKDFEDGLDRVGRLLEGGGDSLDLVLGIATNVTMNSYFKSIKTDLLRSIGEKLKKWKSYQIGLVFYLDYMEDYLTRSVAFSSDLSQVQNDLDKARAEGGGGLTLAAVEAFGDGLSNFVWRSSSRMIILIGDKPPHPSPRGSITDEQVRQWADEKRVDLEMVQLPLGKPFPTPDDQ